jgi:hypothetical protein
MERFPELYHDGILSQMPSMDAPRPGENPTRTPCLPGEEAGPFYVVSYIPLVKWITQSGGQLQIQGIRKSFIFNLLGAASLRGRRGVSHGMQVASLNPELKGAYIRRN